MIKILKYLTSILLVITALCMSEVLAAPLVISHRGASYWAPEETKPAYLLASVLGGDYWEMDIQRSKDGVLLAFHDETLARTTNVAQVFPKRQNDPIGSFTWAELQKLDAGVGFNKAYPERKRPSYIGLKILSLEQIMDLAKATNYSGGLYVESKKPERYPRIEREIINLLKSKGWIDANKHAVKPLIFQSFDRASILQFTQLAPQITRTFLIEPAQSGAWLANIQFGKTNHCILGPGQIMLSIPNIKHALLHSGAPLHVWTIDSEQDLKVAMGLKFAAVFTNRTDLAVPLFHNTPPANVVALLRKLGY